MQVLSKPFSLVNSFEVLQFDLLVDDCADLLVSLISKSRVKTLNEEHLEINTFANANVFHLSCRFVR